MADTWNQSLFMGDVLITSQTSVVMSMTVAGPTIYTTTLALAPGTWFASQLQLWQYLVEQWNQGVVGGQASAVLETDPTSANFGKVLITPDTGFGTITAFSITMPSIYADMGLTSSTWNWSVFDPAYTPSRLSPIFGPLWPLTSMARSTESLTGYSSFSASGVVYSVAGATQPNVTISPTIDRRGSTELADWRRLFTDRWSRGRSCLFYFDRDDVPTQWSNTYSHAESLTLMSQQKRLDFSRQVEYVEARDVAASTSFGLRPGSSPQELV